jgi:hypothetical protein
LSFDFFSAAVTRIVKGWSETSSSARQDVPLPHAILKGTSETFDGTITVSMHKEYRIGPDIVLDIPGNRVIVERERGYGMSY